MRQPICIDFETEAIRARPFYPPKPVGVAIKYPGKKPKYLAWGHPGDISFTIPTGPATSFYRAGEELRDIWRSGHDLLFHNAKFDLDVARHAFGLPIPAWDRVHDTLFTLFLLDPHAPSLGLKPSAERHLGLPPEERDAVRDWLVDHKVITANENPGAHIFKAPSSVVAPYACGDVERTLRLFVKLQPKLDKPMRASYDRERRLLPLMLKNEEQGMRVDVDALGRDLEQYEKALERAEDWLRNRLKAPDLNLDNDKDVGDRLFHNKIVVDWVWTEGGHGRAPQRSVAKANLGRERFTDQECWRTLDYRNRLQTVLSMSMRPWLEQSKHDSMIYTEWNQVRQSHGNDNKGARTGRMSCSRFMNIAKSYRGHEHPKHLRKLLPLPLVRQYILPDKGHAWNHRDYRQQEFRILAHYEDGDLKASYINDPNVDYHELVRATVMEMGFTIDRGTSKTGNFADLYGAGLDKLAAALGIDRESAAKLRAAIRKATPGVGILRTELTRRGKTGVPIRTWGGRLYHCEPPRIAKSGPREGMEMTFEYKLLNYLIQGSAADCTKEAIIRYHELRKDSRMLVTVHDEINISAPVKALEKEDGYLKEAMESVKFDVPMLTDRKVGSSWGSLKEVK